MKHARMRRVAWLYVSVSLTALAVGVVAMVALRTTVHSKHRIVRTYEEVARSAEQLQTASERRARMLRTSLLDDGDVAWRRHTDARRGFAQAFTALSTGAGGAALAAELGAVHGSDRLLAREEERLRAMKRDREAPATIHQTLLREVLPVREDLDQSVAEVVRRAEGLVTAARVRSDEADGEAFAALGLTLILALVTILGLAIVLRDTLRQLASSEDRLRGASEFQRHVMGVVGHDIRSPLAAILMTARVMPGPGASAEEFERARARIVRATSRVDRLAGLLMDVTRLQAAGVLPVSPHAADLHEIVGYAVDEARAEHHARRIEHRRRGDGCGELDEDRLAQVAANLLGNAIRYSPRGSTVEVETAGLADALVLTVHNEGAIAPELLPRVFDPFVRGADDGSRRNVGLGLFVSQQLVAAHGGTIEARSGAAEGTTFEVRLPRCAGPARA